MGSQIGFTVHYIAACHTSAAVVPHMRLVMCIQAGDEVKAEAKPKVDTKDEAKPEVSIASLLVLQVLRSRYACMLQGHGCRGSGQLAAVGVLVQQGVADAKQVVPITPAGQGRGGQEGGGQQGGGHKGEGANT